MDYMKSVDGVLVEMTPEEQAAWDAIQAQAQAFAPLTARQLRLALLSAGITPAMVDVEIAAITDETDRAAAEIEWEYASSYERTHPLIDQMAAAFELPPEQVDTLWLAAADL